jgi:hypothetical protein
MNKRDIIQEIKSIKSRSEFNSRYDYSSRLSDIEYALKEFSEYNGDFNQELLKYIPISTVACFEAFFNSAIKEIVDFGKPFSDNVAKFNQSKNIKLDFEVVAAIQTKSLTVGEFVAHVLPYNNLKDINSNISTLIEKDFLGELKSFNKKSIFENANTISESFHKGTSEILKSVEQTYEFRHIFCHEFATNVRIDQSSILKNFENCKIFLEHSNSFIWELLYPNSPETQTEMNIQAHEEFELVDKELSTLVDKIKNSSSHEYTIESFDQNLFDQTINQWKEYRKLHAEYKASSVKGGSMYPLLYSSDLTYITKEKIKSLEDEFEILLRRTTTANIGIANSGAGH